MTPNRGRLAAAAYVSMLTRVPQARVRSVFARLLDTTQSTGALDPATFLTGQRSRCEAEFGPDCERLIMSLTRAWAADPPPPRELAVWAALLDGRHLLADDSRPAADLARSLSDRGKRIARELGLPLDHVRRGIVIDRLMQRLMTDRRRDWVLKGGTAMASRRAVLGFPARRTLDLDAATSTTEVADIADDLDAAIAVDLGDGVRFRRTTVEHIRAQGKTAIRVKYDMQIGGRVWEPVKVEVVLDTDLTCRPVLAPSAPVAADAPGWTALPYRTVHPADHIADKWAGMTGVQPSGTPSSRFRDLLDMASIVNSEVIEAHDAVRACAQRRRRPGMPADAGPLRVPAATWHAGYRKVAREAARLGVPEAITFPEADAAVTFVAAFLDPVLTGTAAGRWDPELHGWQASGFRVG
ncbi:nucleotidyl transferase AbiEii/AbiGii toxin family protein [Actinoplanes couchii]|uniref:Nucleotidyl transferase AbiEii/AbiGii toxin family protein n=1 Tax=Actinoplanes couchii TaxID=403638 RepID=A0ABQ3WZP6_9ACTN|nr:nucleotidyl transferase AbiEii/AbiGii toxin family protein [Actinoplanes couchii]MDR6316142.1 hypothetical protein [Actinoplanes couchii]GID51757.1 hypothetical protein Aco03nite_001610 [Actinoplanes couchii]